MIGRSPYIEGTRSVAEIHCEDALEPGMIGRSPDIEGTRSVTEIHCGIVVGNKEENNMTDNYNDDYREVIPKEEKTETDVSETQDNEKITETHRWRILQKKIPPKKVRGQKGQQRIRRCLLYLPQTGEQSRQNVQAAQPYLHLR